MNSNLNLNIKHLFAEKGFKTTSQRIIIYNALTNDHNHPSAEHIYDAIKDEHPSISLGTVYKTLDLFVEKGLAHKVATKDGINRYDGNISNHHHIYISDTSEIVDFKDGELELIIKDYLHQKNIDNFDVTNVHIQINGKKINPEKGIKVLSK